MQVLEFDESKRRHKTVDPKRKKREEEKKKAREEREKNNLEVLYKYGLKKRPSKWFPTY
jgi:hypothetical protein